MVEKPNHSKQFASSSEKAQKSFVPNVGIGTTTPTAGALVVEKNSASKVDLLTLSNQQSASWGNGGKLKFTGDGNREMANIQSYWDTDNTGSYLTMEVRKSSALVNVMLVEQSGAFNHPLVNFGGSPVTSGAPSLSPRLRVVTASPNGDTVVNALTLLHIDSNTAATSGIGNRISFQTESNAANTYGETGAITSVLDEATDGSKDGSLRFETLGPNAAAGTRDATEKMRITSAGYVGIGTSAPQTTLDVNGTIKSTAVSNATTTIDFASGNLQYTSASCDATILNNLKSGATYNLAFQGAAGGTCAFTAYSDNGVTLLTVKTSNANLVQSANAHILFSFMVMGNFVYVSSIDGY